MTVSTTEGDHEGRPYEHAPGAAGLIDHRGRPYEDAIRARDLKQQGRQNGTPTRMLGGNAPRKMRWVTIRTVSVFFKTSRSSRRSAPEAFVKYWQPWHDCGPPTSLDLLVDVGGGALAVEHFHSQPQPRSRQDKCDKWICECSPGRSKSTDDERGEP